MDGQTARRAVDRARDVIATTIGAQAAEITFTSGGTESDNLALFGILYANRERGHHLVTTLIEHEAVLKTARFLEIAGYSVTYVSPDSCGSIDPEKINDAITDRTVLVSVMMANNEVGTLQPVYEIGQVAHARGALFHTDAVQAFGQIPVLVDEIGADLMSLSAHKIYGPKGAGALYVRQGVALESLLHGGSQERERRPGTENVSAIVGFAEAASLAVQSLSETALRLARLRDLLEDMVIAVIPRAVVNGRRDNRLPNSLNVSFPGLDASALLVNLDLAGISASSGSACSSGSIEPSHVLVAMGHPDDRVRSAIRFSLGRETTEEEIVTTVEALSELAARLGYTVLPGTTP